MSETSTSPLEPFIDQVLNAVAPALSEGLSPEQATWARDAYRVTVLPHRLRFAANEGAQERRQRAEIVVQDITGRLGALRPSEKWASILGDYYRALLAPVDQAAFELATQFYLGQRSKDELRLAAQQADDRLKAVVAELRQHAPAAMAGLGDLVSEASLDLGYVASGRPNAVSLRLNRFIEDQERPPTCPSCEAPNPRGSRFCVQCGSRMREG